MKNPEYKTGIENIEKESKIVLHFFRHSIKEKSSKSDEEVDITKEGAELAASKASENTNIEQSLAFGSSRVRTQETAALVMAGKKIEETPQAREVIDELNKNLNIGSKVGVNENLDFKENEDSEYYKELLSASTEGQYLKYLVEQSDNRAKEFKDDYNVTYSKQAKQIAQIIEKYIKILPRWNELVSDLNKKYDPKLERFMGTHLGIGECFIAKIIEKTKGIEERDKFVEVLKNIGFNFVEGFDIEIIKKPNEQLPIIHLKYSKEKDGIELFKFDENIEQNLLNEIINE
jgi:hypothetical protein